MLFQMALRNGLAVPITLLFVFFAFAVFVFLTVFWILMIVDCAKRDFVTDGERVAWILVLVFLGFLGAVVYYFAVKRE